MIILTEVNRFQTDKYHVFSLICPFQVLYRWKQGVARESNDVIEEESGMVEGREGIDNKYI